METQRLGTALEEAAKRMEASGRRPCLITSPDLRRYVRAFAERRCPSVAVLSFREIDADTNIRPVETVGGPAPAAPTAA